MKYFKDVAANQVYAYELDGSQDHLIGSHLVAISDEEASKFSKAVEAAMLAKAGVAQGDPVDRLKRFLAANPDVQQMLNGA